MMRSRNHVYTLNNYTDSEVAMHKKFDCKYHVFGKEIGVKDKTPHLQGYVEWASGKTLLSLKKLSPRAHWAVRAKGSNAKAAAEYCKKDGDVFESGTISNQGKRKDIDELRDALDDGANMREILRTCPNYQSIQITNAYLTYNEPERAFVPHVEWLWGESGAGKSRFAHDKAKELGLTPYLHSGTDRWWPGYDAHKFVILDDMRGDFCTLNRMLNLLDRYSCRVEVKGGHRSFLAEYIYITCDRSPRDCWPNKNEDEHKQLLRRITRVAKLSKPLIKPMQPQPVADAGLFRAAFGMAPPLMMRR